MLVGCVVLHSVFKHLGLVIWRALIAGVQVWLHVLNALLKNLVGRIVLSASLTCYSIQHHVFISLNINYPLLIIHTDHVLKMVPLDHRPHHLLRALLGLKLTALPCVIVGTLCTLLSIDVPVH